MAAVRLPDVDETEDLVLGSPCTIEYLAFESADLDDLWVHLYDAASVAAVTVGVTTPTLSLPLPAGTMREWKGIPYKFLSGVVVAAVQEFSGGATGPGANEVNGNAVVR